MWKSRKWARLLECYQLYISRVEEALARTLQTVDTEKHKQEHFELTQKADRVGSKVECDADLIKELSTCKEELVRLKLVRYKLERSEIAKQEKVFFRKRLCQYPLHQEHVCKVLFFAGLNVCPI